MVEQVHQRTAVPTLKYKKGPADLQTNKEINVIVWIHWDSKDGLLHNIIIAINSWCPSETALVVVILAF